jgi:hypothetical protein
MDEGAMRHGGSLRRVLAGAMMLFGACAACSSLQAQTSETTVVVMDLDSVPLAQAAVQVDDLLVFTNASGQATLLCKGASVLKVFAEGHQSFLLDPFACNGRTWTVTLTPLEVTIGEVVVEEARETNGVQPALTMSATDIEAVPSSTGIPDLLTSLKTTASVGSNVEGQKGIVSRGGNYDQATIRADGFPLMNSTHLFGLLSMFPNSVVERVGFFANEKPIDCGTTLGSVVEVSFKERFSKEKGHSGQILSSVIASEIQVERSDERSFFQFGGRRSNLEVIQGLIDKTINTNSSRDISAVYGFDDLSLKGSHFWGKHKFGALFLVSSDRVNYDLEFAQSGRAYRNQTNWSNALAGLTWKWFVRDEWNVEGRLGWNDYHSELIRSRTVPLILNGQNAGMLESNASFMNHVETRQATLKTEVNLERVQSRFGLEWQSLWVHPRFQESTGDEGPVEAMDASSGSRVNSGAIFAEMDVELSPALEGQIGVRLASWQLDEGREGVWLPKGRLTWRLAEGHRLSFHSALSTQALHLLTLNDFGFVPELWVASSGARPVERSWQTGLRWQQSSGPNSTTVDLYLRGMSELLAFKPGVMFDQDIESLLAQDVVAGGLGAVYGLEVSKTHRWNDVKLDMAYAHGRSSRQFEDLNGGRAFPFTFDIRHDATTSVQWDLNERWGVTLMHVFSTGRWLNISEESVSFAMANPSTSSSVVWTSYPMADRRNSYQLGRISRWDCSVSRTQTTASGLWKAQFGVYNLTNRVNPYAAIWSENDEGNPVIEEIGLIPLLPNVSFKYAWN